MRAMNELTARVFGLLFLLIAISPAAKAQYDDYDDNVSLEAFYDELSPYGVWIDDPQYGKVWRPDVDQEEFRPYYTRGHWEMTKYGNTWVSDYDWGWAPFHYGRWHHQSRTGWVWVPGTTWGPAWVSWRSGGGHYGWAPLGPGININVNIGRIPNFWWVFIPQRQIYYRSYPRYDWRRNANIYHNTVIINNVYVNNRNRYYTGPRADEIRRVTRQPVVIHDIRGQGPSRYANRPEVNRGLVQSPRPSRPGDDRRNSIDGRSDNSTVNDNRSSVSGRPSTLSETPADNSFNREATSARPDRVSARPADTRTGEQRVPTSHQPSPRIYDNQEIGRSQSAQRAREQITERRQQHGQSSAPPREQRAERPQQREVSRDYSRQEAPRSERSSIHSERGGSPERSSDGRPSRVH